MFEPHGLKKTLAFIVIGLFLGAGSIPIMNGSEIKILSDDNHSIEVDVATRVASVKLHELGKIGFSITGSIGVTNDKGEPLFYVFYLNPQGYLVVSASYDLPPVIAYSFTSNFHDGSDANPLYDLLFADMTLRLENIQKLPENIIQERHLLWDSYADGSVVSSGRFEQWPPEGSTPTEGWILTNWHQSPPYNNFCPLDIYGGGARSVAGCPAVAMAQILNFHNTTNYVAFNDSDDYHHNYGGNNYWIDNNYVTYGFPSFPQLNTYLDTLQSHYENQIPLTNNDKAAITFACGVAATQVYTAAGSGTFGVIQAYDAYQRFNCSTAELLHDNDTDLYQRLSNNMKDALPAHLAIVNEEWTSGHNVVVDGYNTDEYYHLNFGWGGSYNGWYLIPEEIPYELTVIEGVIVDILKEDMGTPDLSCTGTLEWTNVTPNETITGSFTVRNIGEPGSNLDWEITEWPTWGTWSFTPSNGHNLKPEDGPVSINVNVVVPNEEHQVFSGQINVVNSKNSSDYETIPVTLETGYKIHEKLSCNGSLTWVDVKPGATITGSFIVENIGAALTNLSWEISEWPEWGTWTFTPSAGNNLTPEEGPIIINVSVVAPVKRNSEFSSQITIVNSENTSDNDTIAVVLGTPYHPIHSILFDILQALMERFPQVFPMLRLLLSF
jgi:hypothetical protein